MKNKGFTLVELLVSSGIFSVVVITIISVFTSSMKLQDNILSAKKIVGELNYALEFMGRNLRMAVKDRVGGCTLIGTSYLISDYDEKITFKNVFEASQCQHFFLEDDQIKFGRESNPAISLTSPGVKVTKLQFSVTGNEPDDETQPLVTIVVEAFSGKMVPIKLQTSISQRNLDVNY